MLLRCLHADRESIYRSSGHELTIGRPSRLPVDVDLSPDRFVSQVHARFFYDLGTWWIEDLGSRNGSFVNGSRVLKPVALSPGDIIHIGTTTIRAEFFTAETASPAGVVQAGLPVEEAGELSRISEDQRLETLAGIASIVAESRGKPSMLEGFLRELRPTFRSAERMTIALVEDREIVPRVFSPAPQSYISFTLARRAIVSQQALHWVPTLMRG
jgi:hypothetical protein